MLTLCQVGIGLVAASVAVAMLSTRGKKEFMASLTPEQLSAYRHIARSRLVIYLASLAAGAAGGWLAPHLGIVRSPGWSGACARAGVGAVVSYVVYRIWPKKHWMIDHLTGNAALGVDAHRQAQLWLEMYKTVSWNFHAGFLVGLAGYAVALRGAGCSTSDK